ncbi:signal recognition particle-docking protein FtsY [Clostridioides mangenotii]|uniref:signal recognition particle-docking protein FtsY n=1 Tax=Metaclostridioides mangenotii TaxID=1540 RepID=UPI00214A1C8B|nr:signal recognition particle-docking protein FtsY [Clostridioides mangenotii]
MFKKFFKSRKQQDDENEVRDLEQALEDDESQNIDKIQDLETETKTAGKDAKEFLAEDTTEVLNDKEPSYNDKNSEPKELDEVIASSDAIEVEKKANDIDSNLIDEPGKLLSEDAKAQVLEDKFEEKTKVEETEVDFNEPNINMFERLKQGLTKAKQGITDKIDIILKSYTKVDEELLEDLEEILITSDVGVNSTMGIIDTLRSRIKEKGITDPMDVRVELKNIVEEILTEDNTKLDINPTPCIILMVGVNGVGKTTTIGKLATRYKKEGKKVLLAAADTFRAAATEQLDIWAKRANVDIIKHHEGADPGAVVFDAVKAARARGVDVLICDTAGRLHNKTNLMNELGKIFKIVDREFSEAKREVLLVVDATTGQNAVSQAKTFKDVADITGIVLTKLDGTAKGGVVLAVKSEVDVPVKLIGVGEKAEDLQDFDAKLFSEALFGN